MSRTKKMSILLIATVSAVATLFNNCSPVHTSSTGDFSSLSACQAILAQEFEIGYYPFVKANCAACHSAGPGSGFFASNEPGLSFAAFSKKGADKIAQFATSTHKQPYTGTQHTAAIAQIKSGWDLSTARYNSCAASTGGNGGGNLPNTVAPTKMLAAKDANPALNQTVTLTWDTGSEFVVGANNYTGGQLLITVRGVTITNGPAAFQFENLRFINNSPNPAYVQAVAVFVNGLKIDGSTFSLLERYIPNTANNNSRLLAPGANFFAVPSDFTPGAPLRVQLAVGILGKADIDFAPVTYATLAGAGGIFAANCQGCHGNNGGLNLGANNYNNIVGRSANSDKTLVSPYTLMDNFIYQRMNDPDAPMPQGGLLPQNDRNRVRDWILDGAPLNDAAIAR